MSDNKKYYWLKLKTDFFNQREIKKLRKIAGGDTYTIIYLKLQLLCVKNDGVVKFEGTENNLVEQLELELDEDIDNIKITLSFLESNGLIEKISNNDYLMPKVCSSIGKEGSSARRVRKHREKKLLQSNGVVTKCNTEIEIEKEKEIDIEQEKEIDIFLLEAKEVATYLEKKLKEYDDSIRTDSSKWIKDIELAIRRDKRTKQDLISIIDFIHRENGDGFWIPNIRSGNKLREKYETIYLQLKKLKKSKQNTKWGDIPKGFY